MQRNSSMAAGRGGFGLARQHENNADAIWSDTYRHSLSSTTELTSQSSRPSGSGDQTPSQDAEDVPLGASQPHESLLGGQTRHPCHQPLRPQPILYLASAAI